jgi:hypothetical protein
MDQITIRGRILFYIWQVQAMQQERHLTQDKRLTQQVLTHRNTGQVSNVHTYTLQEPILRFLNLQLQRQR